MNYPKVLISTGDLRGLESPVLTTGPGLELSLQWQDNSNQACANLDDQLTLVAYAPQKDSFEIFTGIATRQETQLSLSLPNSFSEQEIHCWATFMNASESRAAISSYLEE